MDPAQRPVVVFGGVAGRRKTKMQGGGIGGSTNRQSLTGFHEPKGLRFCQQAIANGIPGPDRIFVARGVAGSRKTKMQDGGTVVLPTGNP